LLEPAWPGLAAAAAGGAATSRPQPLQPAEDISQRLGKLELD